MGKQKKEKALKGNRSNPISRTSLGDQMVLDRYVDPLDQKFRKKSKNEDEMEDPEFVDEKMTNKILNQARMQQMHLENDLAEEEDPKFKKEPKSKSAIRSKKSYLGTNSDESDDDELQQLSDEDDGSCSEFYNDIKIDPEEEKALEMFMNKDAGPSKRLGDLVMEKYTEKLTELDTVYSEAGLNAPKLDPRVQAMYEGVKDILAKYRSGKLPKAFKLIPRLSNWEQVLYITDPNGWTAATMYQATRIFASNLKEKMAQRFFNLVLLPRIRDDISQYKKLNFHLYQALRKALFKPGAFMKGIIIPLCESGDCTLREAIIVGSVVGKNSIPLLHSSAAMLKIAEMDYNGANSIFLKTFVDKKYALPYRVIDAMVYHFLKFERDKRVLPVLWHQSFLSFVQRYKDYLSSEQKEALQGLLRVQLHQQITPEIRRELMNSKCRDDIAAESEINKSEGVDDDNMN